MVGVAVLLSLLVVLSCGLARRRGWWVPAPPAKTRLTPMKHLIALVVLGIANVELVAALVQRPLLLGDLRSHAMIAREIALGHAHAGWIDVYGSGFPLGPHYPSVAWLLAAALMRLGLHPAVAVTWLGVCSVLFAHWLVFRLAMRAGASFSAALVGAVVVSSMTFLNSYFGGAEAILVLGLLTQCVAVPLCLLLASSVLQGARRRWLVPLAALAVAAHPQLVISEMALLGALVIVADRAARRRWALAIAAQIIAGGAIFGLGVATMKVPFGWPPPNELWRIEGKRPGALLGLLVDGELFDFARTPVVTAVVACAAVVLLANLGTRRARIVVGASIVAFVLACAGHPLADAGRIGALVLMFFQPMRAYLLLPFVAAGLVIVATMEAEAWLRRWSRLGALSASIAIALFIGRVTLPAQWIEVESRRERLGLGPCGRWGPSGYDEHAAERALATLSSGRLYYSDAELADCAAATDLDAASAVPIGYPFAGGAHVGVIFYAFDHAAPAESGGDARAASLGVRYWLTRSPSDEPATRGWHERMALGDTRLWERNGEGDLLGVGCVDEAIGGSDRAIRIAIFEALDQRSSWIWDPKHFARLDFGTGELRRNAVVSDCDSTGARTSNERRVEPGRYEVDVDSPKPVDLVLRETAYASWRFSIDDVATHYDVVAPGFMVVRLPAGAHHVRAWVEPSVGYTSGLLLACVALGALALSTRRGWSLRWPGRTSARRR